MTAKRARQLLFALTTVFLCVAAAQQQLKPNRTVSYFTKNDPKYGEVLSALGDEPKCATVDVNVHDDSAPWLPSGGRSTKIDPTHETWWLIASPKEYRGYKKYRYNYVLEPPGTLTLRAGGFPPSFLEVVNSEQSEVLEAGTIVRGVGVSDMFYSL